MVESVTLQALQPHGGQQPDAFFQRKLGGDTCAPALHAGALTDGSTSRMHVSSGFVQGAIKQNKQKVGTDEMAHFL
eukprot:228428-Pyramimonas_sp.AAC.1